MPEVVGEGQHLFPLQFVGESGFAGLGVGRACPHLWYVPRMTSAMAGEIFVVMKCRRS